MKLNYKRGNGLLPAIVQDAKTNVVLMLAYMNEEALKLTKKTGKVTFFSRGRNKLWVKGETSGNYLLLKEIISDCDSDTILIKAEPVGPVCHTGNDTCFKEANIAAGSFLYQLENIIRDRKKNPSAKSYTASLFKKGLRKIAQKVGEEATEVVIDAIDNQDDLLKEEISDLLYHLLVLMAEKDISLAEIESVLAHRHSK
jgi:phosphoribosyl-AMP cyclohydrolase / phosphoribosyl-ATP pyrophosphohydrolase